MSSCVSSDALRLIGQLVALIASQSDILAAWRLRTPSQSHSRSLSGSRSADRRVHPGSMELPSTASLQHPDSLDVDLAGKELSSYPPSSIDTVHIRLDEAQRVRLPPASVGKESWSA